MIELAPLHTPGTQSIDDVGRFLKKPTSELVKTLVFDTNLGCVMVLGARRSRRQRRQDQESPRRRMARDDARRAISGRPPAVRSATAARSARRRRAFSRTSRSRAAGIGSSAATNPTRTSAARILAAIFRSRSTATSRRSLAGDPCRAAEPRSKSTAASKSVTSSSSGRSTPSR